MILSRSKIILIVLLTLALIADAVFYFLHIQKNSNLPSFAINGHKFFIEIADEPAERSKGLSKRENLCDDCGMIFLFNKSSQYAFWMKDMKFPLDFIWIAGDKIIDIDENIPADYSGILKPEILVDKVLEINAGVCDKYKIEIGDEIKIDLGLHKGK